MIVLIEDGSESLLVIFQFVVPLRKSNQLMLVREIMLVVL